MCWGPWPTGTTTTGSYPARSDVVPGAKGSIEYANRLRAERGEPQLVEREDGTIAVAASA